MKTSYVLGFRFDGDNVLLIRKDRPDWQKGKLNGLGGKVEDGEYDAEAMVREFREETGIETSIMDWNDFGVMNGPGWRVRLFKSFGSISEAKTMTDEEVVVANVNDLPDDVIPNLRWLIPLCREDGVVTMHYFK